MLNCRLIFHIVSKILQNIKKSFYIYAFYIYLYISSSHHQHHQVKHHQVNVVYTEGCDLKVWCASFCACSIEFFHSLDWTIEIYCYGRRVGRKLFIMLYRVLQASMAFHLQTSKQAKWQFLSVIFKDVSTNKQNFNTHTHSYIYIYIYRTLCAYENSTILTLKLPYIHGNSKFYALCIDALIALWTIFFVILCDL